MLLYAISTLPLVDCLQNSQVKQCWYADDSSAQGTVVDLKSWWDRLNLYGPNYGYYPQGQKSYLVVHPDDQSEAALVFSGSGIKVVLGHRFLGGYIGQETLRKEYVADKVKK